MWNCQCIVSVQGCKRAGEVKPLCALEDTEIGFGFCGFYMMIIFCCPPICSDYVHYID